MLRNMKAISPLSPGMAHGLAARSFSLPGRLRSVTYAVQGLRTVLVSQPNTWIHSVASVLVVIAGFSFGVGRFEWFMLIVAMVSVWTAELLNTALEFLCDVASPDFHPLVRKAKDVAAAAVLICAAGALVTGGLVFLPYFLPSLP